MDAFLNKPSDFTEKCLRDHEPLKLLPPSEFEKPKPTPGPWPELNKAADEIAALRVENQSLRDKIEGFKQSDSAASQSPASCQCHLVTGDRRYADELISRQAEELSKLRSQVQQLKHDQQTLQVDCEHRIAVAEQEREATVSALSDNLQRREEEHEQEIGQLNQEHEGEVSDLQTRLEHLASDLNRSKGDLNSRLTEMREELQTVQKDAKSREEDLLQEIREKDSAIQSQKDQIQRLHIYITENEEKHRPQEVWIQQCETLNNKLKVAEAELETLKSSAQLMEIRLSSVREILNTHEVELSKGKENTLDRKKLKELLLTRWREKVYTLLIQQKSAQLVSRKDLQNWKEKTEVLEDKLTSAHNTINILQHTVVEKDAELSLAVNTNKRLQKELTQAEELMVGLNTHISRDEEAVQQLPATVQRYKTQWEQQMLALQQAFGHIRALGQRVSFASSRMDILKCQLTRKEALKQLDEKKNSFQDDTEVEESWRVERKQLNTELLRVSGERDVLAAQLQHDSQMWSDRIASLRSQYEAEISAVKNTVEDLEHLNQEKSQTLEQTREEATIRQTELSEMTERVNKLSTELARHQFIMQQALVEQRKELEREWTELLADLEHKLNDARRDYTKAVVSLRQQERQWAREKERREEIQSTTEAQHTAQLERLQQQLKVIQQEKNICMATLRQEGLLGRLRSERGESKKLVLNDEVPTEPMIHHSESMETDSLQKSPESVSMILKDLKSLVPAVLEDSLDSSDENQD